jgi:hypothetical protein
MEHRSPALSSFDPTRSPACGLLPSVASRGVSPQDQQIDTSVAGGRTENWVRFVIFEGGGKHAAMRIEVGPSSWVINGCMLLHCDSLLNRALSRVYLRFHVLLARRGSEPRIFGARSAGYHRLGRVPVAKTRAEHVGNTWSAGAKHQPNTWPSGRVQANRAAWIRHRYYNHSGKARAELAMEGQNSISVAREARLPHAVLIGCASR